MPPSTKHVWLLLSAALVLSLVYLAGDGRAGFPLDDSWIHLQFARNLAAGAGLSYQEGDLVTGSTAPLWTALLSLVFLLPTGQFLAVKLLGILFYLGSVHALYLMGRELHLGHGLALLAAGLFLATDWMVWSALSGMEIALFVWVSLWGMILQARERVDGQRLPLALPLFAAGTLIRPEGVLLLLLAAADQMVVLKGESPRQIEPGDPKPEQETETRGNGRLNLVAPRWKPLFCGLGLAVLVLLPALMFYRVAGGSWLPTTFAVKTEGVRHLLPSGRDVYRCLGILFRPQPFMLLLAGAGILRLLARVGTRRDRGLLPALWLVTLPLAYSTLSSPDRPLLVGNFGRYFFPLFPALVLLGVLGLEPLAHRLGLLRRRLRLPVTLTLVLLLLWPTASTAFSGRRLYAQNVRNVEDSDIAVGRWIERNLPQDAVLALQDIGAIKYLVKNPIIDLTGIVNPEILPYIKGPLVGSHPSRLGGLFRFLQDRGADMLVVYPASYPGLRAFLDPQTGLKPLHRVVISDPPNITMAGDELVVFSTPWSRFRSGIPDPPARPPLTPER